MSEPTQQELEESIQALQDYQKRLRNEVINMSKKLRISPSQLESRLKSHNELKQIEEIIAKLNNQKSRLS